MRKKILLFFYLFMIGINISSFAQTLEISGIVKDEMNEPIIGASVLVKGTATGVATNVDGQFKITVPSMKSVLVISYIGYLNAEVPVKNNMTVQLAPKSTELSEVVVTGIFNKPKESYTGSAVMMTSKDLEEAGSRNLVSSIANVVPGFQLSENILGGSNPNNMPYIRVRGTTNVSADLTGLQSDADAIAKANLPLIVLNGFEISLERMMDLDEDQIHNVTILKDASATAMYGTKGSNGVIVISTKKPGQGKLRVTYKGTLDLQIADLDSYNLMNSREKLEYENLAGLYKGRTEIATQELLELYNDRLMDVARGVDTYWIKYPVRNGVGYRHSLSVEGGTDNLRYGGNVAYREYNGAMKGNSRTTFNGNIFLQYTVKAFSFQNDLYITDVTAKESPYGKFSDYALINQYFTPYDENGHLKKTLENKQYRMGWTNKVYNPLYNADQPSKNESQYTRIENNFSVEWHILPEFFIRGKLGVVKQNKRTDIYKSATHTDFDNYSEENYERKGTYIYSPDYQTKWETQFTANYSNTFNDRHMVFGGLGLSAEESTTESYTLKAEGLTMPEIAFLGQASHYEKSGSPKGKENKIRSAGLIFNGTYSYDNRYTVDLNGKYEGSSKFGKNNRYNYFWSVGTGWNLHHEHFLQEVKWIDYARFRVSYGITGDPLERANQSLRTYATTSGASYQGWYGVFIDSYGNYDLKMPRTGQFNVGFDWEILDRRIKLAVDVYEKRTKDMILKVDLPASSGFKNYFANVGEVSNKGFEVTGTFTPLLDRSKGLRLDIGGTMTHVRNKLVRISNLLESFSAGTADANMVNPNIMYTEGKSITTIYAVKSKGIDPASGREIFVNRDGLDTYAWSAADRVDCGNEDPKLIGTINVTARYRGFNATAYFAYELGAQVYNKDLASKVENIKPYQNADCRALNNRWQEPGQQAMYKSIKDFSDTKATSRFVMDNDIFKLTSINLGYDVPQAWSNKYLKIPYMSIKATLNDIFYLSTIKRERGIDAPFSRQYSLALTVRL